MLTSPVCGIGRRGIEHARAHQKCGVIELKGSFDISAKKRQIAENILGVTGFDQLTAMLHETKPELIAIATPPQVRIDGVQNPIVSVIMPMSDHRGMGAEAIQSWVEGQRCDSAWFELILIIDDTLSRLEKMFWQMLRPQDKLIKQAADNEMQQYDLGAKKAAGRLLFFTEPHCIAEPDAIAEIVHFFKTHDLDGFCARTFPLCRNQIARMESRMYDEGIKQWSQPDDWRKVILRGFGLSRQLYLEVGGFNYHYQRFAEWLLAATLRRKGFRLGYAPGVGVGHLYTTNFGLLDKFIHEFTDGESLYRVESSPEICEPFFGSPPEWNEAWSFDRGLVFLLVGVLSRELLLRQGIAKTHVGLKECLKHILRLLPLAVGGHQLLTIRSQLIVWWAKLRCYLWWLNNKRMYRAFLDYYMGMTSLCRVKFARNAQDATRNSSLPNFVYSIGEIGNKGIFGFHALERYEGQQFRWSSAVAALKVRLRPQNYLVTVLLNKTRQVGPQNELSVYLNNNPVRNVTFNVDRQTLTFTVPRKAFSGMNQWLIFLCRPWTLNDVHLSDNRSLGLPLISVRFEPVETVP